MDDGFKTVVMIGGYGENFLRPFSLVNYSYYLIKFDGRGNIVFIEKKLIYDRTFLINTKFASKNLGIIKTYSISRNR